MKRTMLVLAMVAGLLLSACGSSDENEAIGSQKSPEDATIRLWLNGEDTSQELVDLALAEFKKEHPDVTVKFERQQWTGLVEKLTTSLSGNDAPDVIELGNTQAQTFEAAGALVDLTEEKERLGGDDLVQSLTEAGTYDGKFYGVPYYGGARDEPGVRSVRRRGARWRGRDGGAAAAGVRRRRHGPPSGGVPVERSRRDRGHPPRGAQRCDGGARPHPRSRGRAHRGAGAELHVHLRLTGTDEPFIARFPPRNGVRVGDTLKVAVDVGELHLFDPATGAALRDDRP